MQTRRIIVSEVYRYQHLKFPFDSQEARFVFNDNRYLDIVHDSKEGLFKFSLLKSEKEFFSIIYTIEGDKVIIGKYASFGAIEINSFLGFEILESFIEKFISEIIKKGMKQMFWKHFPALYHQKLNAYTIQSLLNLGFIIDGSSLGFYLESSNDFRQGLAPDTLRRFQKFEKSDFVVTVKKQFEVKSFFPQLIEWRAKRLIPVNIKESILKGIISNLPDKYILFQILEKEKLIAFSLGLKITDTILYQFIPAHDPEYDNYSPMIAITASMHHYAAENKIKIVDLGIASEMQGEENYGLIRFKEKLGGLTGMKYTFFKELQ